MSGVVTKKLKFKGDKPKKKKRVHRDDAGDALDDFAALAAADPQGGCMLYTLYSPQDGCAQRETTRCLVRAISCSLLIPPAALLWVCCSYSPRTSNNSTTHRGKRYTAHQSTSLKSPRAMTS